MKKVLQFLVISLIFGIGLGSISHAGRNEVKLVGAEEGNGNNNLTTDIVGDTVIVGSHGEAFVTVYVNNRNKWEKRAELRAKDHNNRDPAVP